MYLKRLEIKGFKSFPTKTEIVFNEGITAIVGPNGSGKSNISDAIRWVLGEQSAKSLRGDKLEDVIFVGTESKKAMNYCEVAITLDNSDNKLDLGFSEVTIKRRAYRTGESEFFLNNKSCRLKDIKEILLDTGIGKDGYSIVEQGKVDEILSNNPVNRRKVFDEACGISKFRYKKQEAERNLKHTKENLERIDDIYIEIENQLKPLFLQQEKAAKYLEFSKKLKVLEVNSCIKEVAELESELDELNKHSNLLGSQSNEIQKQKSTLEKAVEETNIEIENISRNKRKSITNELTSEIQNQLRFNSSAGRISDIDFYKIAISQMKRKKFIEVCTKLKTEKIINECYHSKFHIIAKKRLFVNATDLSKNYPKRQSFVSSFIHYKNPLEYIEALEAAGVNKDEIYKLFITIDYDVLNEYGLPVSGGERSEFNLIQAIRDARNYDMLLVDEPESSFDNVFLKENINIMLKEMSREMPVIIVTHNSTIGASIQPDYIIYTERTIENNKPIFKIYYGHPNDKHLQSHINESKQNFLIQINSLEAGKDAYNERKQNYANLEN